MPVGFAGLPPLSAEAIAVIVTRHLAGHWPKCPTRQPRPNDDPRPELPPVDQDVDIVLDPDFYTRGLDARRRGHETVAKIRDLLDDAVTRMDALLEQTEALLREALGGAHQVS